MVDGADPSDATDCAEPSDATDCAEPSDATDCADAPDVAEGTHGPDAADGTGGPFDARCPRCDAFVDGDHAVCPECGLRFLDEDGGISDEVVDALFETADVMPPEELSPTRFGAPRSIRIGVALAISLPLAPVVTLVVLSVLPLPGILTALVALAAWSVPAYALSGSTLPTLIVANGLGVLGLTMATAPLVIAAGRALAGTDPARIGPLGTNVVAIQGIFLVVGVAVLAGGVALRRQALASERRRRDAEFVERE